MKKFPDREWYSLRSIMGNDWAMFFALLGGREVGKSYSVTEMFVNQWKRYGRPFYWLRLTETAAKKLLANKAEKLVDPDLRRKYNLNLTTKGTNVYDNGKLMARVLALNTFYNDKGSGLFDKDFLNDPNMYYNICLDEMNAEKSEKRTFDIVYSFTNQLENLVRSTKKRLRVIMIGNTLEEASDIMSAFNFIPEDFGRYYVRKKRLVVDYMPLNEKYIKRRQGTVADILAPQSSTFTNKVEIDTTLITKRRLIRPTAIIKFSKEKDKWFTLWDDQTINTYNNEKAPAIAMRPYLNEPFNETLRTAVISRFDVRFYNYKTLIAFKKFQKELEILKPRKGA